MNNSNIKVAVVPFMFMFTLLATGVQAMTVSDEAMMKKEATTTDAMMKKDNESMMKKDDAMMSSTSDAMMKKDAMTTDAMMKKDDAMIAAPSSDLSFGSQGEGVVGLQTFLVSKSLLVMPAGVPMGYFGPLTKAALMNYQAANELPSTGYYGPLTRAVMIKSMMKVTDTMMKTPDAMMKKDDAMMSSTSDAMMKKDDAMMDKKTQ